MNDYYEKIRRFEEEWSNDRDFVTAHTSGSTGRPKEIRLLKSDMIRSARATNEFFNITKDSNLVCPLSIDYIAGKMMHVRSKVAGCHLVMEEPSMTPLPSFSDKSDVDLVAIVPAQLPGLLSSKAVGCIRSLIIGGSPLSPTQESLIAESGLSAWVTYGMTETCSHVALRKIGNKEFYEGLPGYSFSTDDRSCLIIENPSMSFRRLVTNDIVELLDDHTFIVKGRFDNVIISGGEKIFPEVLERLLHQHFSDANFYFTSRESARWGEEIILMVEGLRDISIERKLNELCRKLFPRHHCPKAIIFKPTFDRTSTGKLIRRKY